MNVEFKCFQNLKDKVRKVLETEKLEQGCNWIIVFAAFMIHIISDGIVYTFGIFYSEIIHNNGYNSGETAWIPSTMSGMLNFVGPLAGVLTNKYGCRFVCILGSLVSSAGYALGSLAFNITYLYLTVGLCTGAGIGLMYFAAIISVNHHFNENRSFATGLAACGSGIGTFILAPVLQFLINVYGWKGAMFFASGFLFSGYIFGTLLSPISRVKKSNWKFGSVHSVHNNDKQINLILPRKSISLPILSEYSSFSILNNSKISNNYFSDPSLIHDKENFEILIINEVPNKQRNEFSGYFNFNIFQDSIFIIYIFSNFLTFLGIETVSIYTVEKITHKNIATKREASYLISVIGIFNTLGRIIFGYISDKCGQNRLWLYIGSLAVCGFSISLSTFYFNYIQMIIFSAIFGLFYGAYISLLPIILVDLFGLEKLTDSFGFVLFFQGIASFFGIPITGWLYDQTGSFEPGFLFSGISVLLSSFVMFATPVFQNRNIFDLP
ncbi:monocarboxylate transporter 12-like [Centruroides vittatus]|uniref:monocarboxylate transporter 12-like n=1 Tax=Centruroides vittatus TaxID=120091 RepID=UPI00350F8B4C